jgi:hypothetical protein
MKKTIAVAALTAVLVAIPTAVVTSLLITPPLPTVIYAPGPQGVPPTAPLAEQAVPGDTAAPAPETADGRSLTDVAKDLAESIN